MVLLKKKNLWHLLRNGKATLFRRLLQWGFVKEIKFNSKNNKEKWEVISKEQERVVVSGQKKHKLLRGNIREEGESCLNQLNKILTDYWRQVREIRCYLKDNGNIWSDIVGEHVILDWQGERGVVLTKLP